MNSQVHFRMDEQEKAALTNIYNAQGLSINDAFRIFAKKSLEVGGFPFELSNPNARLQAAINSDDYVNFASAEEGLAFLND
ncbi:type II toxin-antitoxin system RelB/DinJ family antitoxin [Periweissella ghanensis]|uniref:DNA-damage-inducible protein J n=1 Tax=Periweissella ghanensis TaxID=467997 RepID=A0ABN8BNA8_9LACO|nr:type II toxin-antitoxin system RelB/DinJ family antitoxin [Periweissella ghanensis]MCM0601210.1 type II toxin-antitoxin system RelB/DinJ family antitoxin [Periweissella ghanensis]CAH0418010.1 hypothetical protein WGH24286_00426 [Periweissella ghanensis]